MSSYLHGNEDDLRGSRGKNGMSKVDTRTDMTSCGMIIPQHYKLFKCLSSRHHVLKYARIFLNTCRALFGSCELSGSPLVKQLMQTSWNKHSAVRSRMSSLASHREQSPPRYRPPMSKQVPEKLAWHVGMRWVMWQITWCSDWFPRADRSCWRAGSWLNQKWKHW